MRDLAACPAPGGGGVSRAGFSVQSNEAFGLLRLQCFHRKAGSVEALEKRLGHALPGPGGTGIGRSMRFFWSAPGEWLVALERGGERERLMELRARLAGLFVIVDVIGDSRIALDIGGPKSRVVLARGCSLDFHPAAFGMARCVSTRLAGVPVMLARIEKEDAFLLLACRSLADYLLDWFGAASEDC